MVSQLVLPALASGFWSALNQLFHFSVFVSP